MPTLTEGVGERVARLRKLTGWTQAELASHSAVSTILVKQVEQGVRPASPAFTAAVARALGVSVADLHELPYDRPPDPSADHASIPLLRAALDSYDDPQLDGDPITVEQLQAQLDQLEAHRKGSRYSTVARSLPALLQHAYVLVDQAAPRTAAGEAAWIALSDAYALSQATAYRFGFLDLAYLVSGRLGECTKRTGDPLRVAVGQFRRTHLKLASGEYSSALRLMDRAQHDIADLTGPTALAVRGQLHLRQAVIEARARRGDVADAHVAEARAIADTGVAPRPFYDIDCSRLNVDVHWCAIPVELGDGTTAVSRGAEVTLPDRDETSRAGHHWIDQARAWTLHGNRDKALDALCTARRISPQQTRYHPQVRETLHSLAETDRRATDSLSGFARWAGVGL